MGARLYNPTRGLFTSVDPVVGGSDSSYAYPTDPVNAFDIDGQMWGWVFKGGMKALGIVATGACAGTVTMFYLCRAAVSGAISAATYIGYRKYVSHKRWSKTEAVAYFVWGAIASLPGSGLVATSTVASLKYWVKRIAMVMIRKLRRMGWYRLATAIGAIVASVQAALSARRYYR